MGTTLGISRTAGPSRTEAVALLRYPRSRWDGWGCSLAWSGKVLGSAIEAASWADLLFTTGDIELKMLWPDGDLKGLPQTLPGLGLNVVRYNIGGSGRADDQAGEKRSSKSRGWYAEIEGFQPREGGEFDWNRDEWQRRFLSMAVDRGVDEVELFANAPMWWMSRSKSSFGGTLSHPDDFAVYLAEVATHARREWHVPVKSISPFNEPSAGWWNHPHDQEGCNISAAEQEHVLVKLRGELNSRGLDDVVLAASDENTPAAALKTWKTLSQGPALNCVGRLNVHSYDGLSPWKESAHPGVRAALHQLASGDHLPIWSSEFGNGDVYGTKLAKLILEDLRHMRPTAWCYWQLIEHKCSWGLIEAEFSPGFILPTVLPHPKYYVFAHFSRFLRPGIEMLNCTEPWVVAGYCEQTCSIVGVFLNSGSEPCKLTLACPSFFTTRTAARAVLSHITNAAFFQETHADILPTDTGGFELCVEITESSICSVRVEDVKPAFKPLDQDRAETSDMDEAQSPGVTVAQVESMSQHAAWAAATERLHGESDHRTERFKAYFEHACALIARDMEDSKSFKVDPMRDLVWHTAWLVTNERKYGERHHETSRSRANVAACRERCGNSEEAEQVILHTCWAVVNEAWYGNDHKESKVSAARARKLIAKLGSEHVLIARQ